MPNFMELLERIKSWREIAREQNDYFVKFALEYFAFNALARVIAASNKGAILDRDIINRIKNDEECRSWVLGKSSDWIKSLKGELVQKPLINLTRKEQTISLRKEDDWENIVEAVYRIRNNLFHGYKYPGDERDQNLVQVGYHLLSSFNDYFINKM